MTAKLVAIPFFQLRSDALGAAQVQSAVNPCSATGLPFYFFPNSLSVFPRVKDRHPR